MQYIHKVGLNTYLIHYIFTNKTAIFRKSVHTQLTSCPTLSATGNNVRQNIQNLIKLCWQAMSSSKKRKKKSCSNFLSSVTHDSWPKKVPKTLQPFDLTSLLNLHVLCTHVH